MATGAVGKSAMRLQYLMAVADGTLAQITDASVIANFLAIGGDISDFSSTTDSLEAISNALGAISTGDAVAEIGSFTGQTNLKTLLAALGIPDVTAKPLYTCLVTDRLDNATYGLSALHTDITAIPTTMVGTNGAAVASVWTAGLATNIGTTNTSVANGTYGLSALQTLIAAIPTTMVGTDGAFLATDGDKFVVHTSQFTGDNYYADAAMSDNTEAGTSPETAKKEIGAAIGAASAGDRITVKAGTYTETGLNMNLSGLEMIFEIGAVIDPATGTCLTISAPHCKISGNLDIDVPTSQIGLLLTSAANYCEISDCTILNGGTGVNVLGAGNLFRRMAAGLQTVYGYDIDGAQTRLYDSHTVGIGASIGYNIGNGADVGVIKGCTSANHQTSGYTIETGCTNWTIVDCSSGGGDGPRSDVDSANVWSNFTYNDDVSKLLTFSAAGAASVDLFRIYGTVLITGLYGHVDEVLSGDIGTGMLDLNDGINTVDVTDSLGPLFNSLPAGSYAHKVDDAGVNIAIENASQVRMYEDATKFGEDPNFQVTAKAGAFETYLRFTYGDTGTSGKIHWHCRWEPLTQEGFVTPA